jgi:tetratricopeptide (TPR) repeat protein
MEKQLNLTGIMQLNNRSKALLICILLAAVTLAVYWQAGSYEFIHFDDNVYVFDNPHVKTGLKAENIAWAFNISNTEKSTYWHPLTWISHMLDVELFGLNAGMHHMMNVLFHALNAVLLFLVLYRATGAIGRSTIVAALFALHPINVDSVAWVAERKNVLSTMFWLLTMYIYILYADRVTIGKYLLTAGFFVLGLFTKPMLVTLPFVLLLMDYWPLGRIGFPMSREQQLRFEENFSGEKGLSPYLVVILEKVPLLAGALAAIFISTLSIKSVGLMISTASVPMSLRISNAILSYVHYFWKMIWPVHLTIFYPFPASVPAWQVAGSLLLIAAFSAFALTSYRRFPYLIVGWLWFLGTLVPVSGIMQGGLWPAIAERWAYVPYIGLFIGITWYLADILSNRKPLKIAGLTAVSIVLCLFIVKISLQLPFWKNDLNLFQHACEIDPDNYVAHANLANFYFFNGQYDQAYVHNSEALRVKPWDANFRCNMGILFFTIGKYHDAEIQFREALKIDPRNDKYHEKLASILAAQMKLKDAISEYKAALAINPESADYSYSLANLFMSMGNADQAIICYLNALARVPGNIKVRTKLGNAYAAANRLDDAIREYNEVLRISPDSQEAFKGSIAVSARKAMIDEKIRALEAQLGAKSGDPHMIYSLAVLNASKGDFENALRYLNQMAQAQPGDPNIYYNIACIKSRENKTDEAMSSLYVAIQKGFNKWDMIRTDRDLENVRGTEVFKILMKGHP